MTAARCPIGNVLAAVRHRIAAMDPSLIHARPRVWAAIKCFFSPRGVEGWAPVTLGEQLAVAANKGEFNLVLNVLPCSRLINQVMP